MPVRFCKSVMKQGVAFSPGDVFYSDGGGAEHVSIRIFTSERRRHSSGIKIIGDTIKNEIWS